MVSIKRWHAFKAKLPPGSKEAHRIIAVYKQHDIVHYFYVTSKIETACKLARDDINSIVKLNAADWNALTKASCIQCNKGHMFKILEDEFKRLYENEEVECLGEVPENVKKAMIDAITMSKSYTKTERALYTT